MRFPGILPALTVTLLLVSFLSAKDAPDTGLHTFYGQVVLIDPVGKFVVYKPEADGWTGGPSFERRNNAGLFVLSVAADGTVANVAVRQSSGYPELDVRARNWMKKWRFKPNSLTEVQLPMFFTETYRRVW